MESEILNQLSSFNLNDEENFLIEFEENDVRDGITERQKSCYGRFFADKDIDLKSLRWAITKAWKCEKVQIKRLHDRILQFFFNSAEEANRVVEQGPWCFDKELLIVRPWKQGEMVKAQDFLQTQFWIHVKGLPPECYTKDMAYRIARNYPGCTTIQIRENLEDGGKFFRMRATVNILKPIRRTVVLRGPDGGQIFALLRYKRLPIMCFKCGLIGHIAKKCTKEDCNMQEMQEYQYRLRLNADFFRSSILQTVELTEQNVSKTNDQSRRENVTSRETIHMVKEASGSRKETSIKAPFEAFEEKSCPMETEIWQNNF